MRLIISHTVIAQWIEMVLSLFTPNLYDLIFFLGNTVQMLSDDSMIQHGNVNI